MFALCRSNTWSIYAGSFSVLGPVFHRLCCACCIQLLFAVFDLWRVIAQCGSIYAGSLCARVSVPLSRRLSFFHFSASLIYIESRSRSCQFFLKQPLWLNRLISQFLHYYGRALQNLKTNQYHRLILPCIVCIFRDKVMNGDSSSPIAEASNILLLTIINPLHPINVVSIRIW